MLSLSLYKTCAISFLFGNLPVKVKAAPLMSDLRYAFLSEKDKSHSIPDSV